MSRGPVVVDTDVYGASPVPGSPLTRRYAPHLAGRPVFLSFQTVAELRYGALLRGWGPTRVAALEAHIARGEIVHSGPELIAAYARLRVDCQRAGHALAQREHDADRWVAAVAVRLGIPLVANDGIYANTPGLQVETAP